MCKWEAGEGDLKTFVRNHRGHGNSFKGMETSTNKKKKILKLVTGIHNPTHLVLPLKFPTIQATLTGPLHPPSLKTSSEGSKNKVLEQNQIHGDHHGGGGGDGGRGGGCASWHHRKYWQGLRQTLLGNWMPPLPHSNGFALSAGTKLVLTHSLSCFAFCTKGAQTPAELKLGDPGHRRKQTGSQSLGLLF